jgi:hypothetical protein
MNKKPKKEVLVNGVMMTVYSIGWLGLLTNKGIANIRRWERLKILPKPIVIIPGEDRRYYLAAELVGYSEIYKRSDVRAGFPIQKTPFKRQARAFKVQLQQVINNPKKLKALVTKIPNEAAYEKGARRDRERNLKTTGARNSFGKAET